MPAYLVELEGGKKYQVEADSPPTEQDIQQYLGGEQPAAPKDKPWVDISDTLSGAWHALSGLPTTIPHSFRQLNEGLENPWQRSESYKASAEAMKKYSAETEAAEKAAEESGDASWLGSGMRQAGGSLGFSGGAMGASLIGRSAAGIAGRYIGSMVGPEGAVAGEVLGRTAGALGASYGAAYRMAGAQFLDDARDELETKFQQHLGRPMTEQEQKEAYAELRPLAEKFGHAEAGPEAIGNLAMGMGGRYVLGLGRKKLTELASQSLLKTGAKKLASQSLLKTGAKKLAAGVGAGTVELGGETGTQVEQKRIEKEKQALLNGEDPNAVLHPDRSLGEYGQALGEVAPATIAQSLLGLGAGAAYKGIKSAVTPTTPQQPETSVGATPTGEPVPVRVNGQTIAHIPPGSTLTPEDVAMYAAEPGGADTLKAMARKGYINLPEVVAPVPGVDRAITRGMNDNIAAGAALAPKTFEEVEREKQSQAATAEATAPPNRRQQIQARLAEIEQQYGPRADVTIGAEGNPDQIRPRRINTTEEDALLKEIDGINASENSQPTPTGEALKQSQADTLNEQLRQQEEASKAEEVRLEQMRAQEEQAAARDAEARQKAYDDLKKDQQGVEPYTEQNIPADKLESLQYLLGLHNKEHSDDVKREAEKHFAALLNDDPKYYRFVRSGNSKVFLDTRTGEYVKLTSTPGDAESQAVLDQTDLLKKHGARFAEVPQITTIFKGNGTLDIHRQKPVGAEGASIFKDLTPSDKALFLELQKQNPLSSDKDLNPALRVETDSSLKNMGLVLGADGQVRAMAFDFDGIPESATPKDRAEAVHTLNQWQDMPGVPLVAFSPKVQDLIRSSSPQVSPVTTETKTPSNAANVAGGSQSAQTESAGGSGPTVTGDIVSTSDIPATAEIQPEVGRNPTTDLEEYHALAEKRGQAQNKVKGVTFSKKEETRFQELATTLRPHLRETVDPVYDPVVGEDINGQPIRRSVKGTFYTVENGRVRTGPSFKEEAPLTDVENWTPSTAEIQPTQTNATGTKTVEEGVRAEPAPGNQSREVESPESRDSVLRAEEERREEVAPDINAWAPQINLPATASINGHVVVGTVGAPLPAGKVNFHYNWNGKPQVAVVRSNQLSRPVTALSEAPRYIYTQEQNSRKAGKHIPVTPGVHENFNFQQAFASMAKDKSLSRIYQEIAKLLAKMPVFGNMDLHIVADENVGYAGEYSHTNGKSAIAVNLRQVARGKVDALGTLLHEALHHVTLAKVRNPQGAFEQEVVAKLDQIRKHVAAYAKKKGLSKQTGYELGTNEEFISALTRPDFQDFLASIPVSAAPGVAVGKFRSVLSEVFRLIAELVSGREVAVGSTLEQYMTSVLALFETPHRALEVGPLEKLSAVQSKPEGYRSPADLLAETAAKMRGEQASKPAGLNSMFNPQSGRPATGERTLFETPKESKPIDLTTAYQKARKPGSSTAWVTIKDVYEQAHQADPALTPEAFMAHINEQNEAGGIYVQPVEQRSTVEAARPFVVGGAGVEMLVPETPASLAEPSRKSLRVRVTREALTNDALSQASWKDWYQEHQDTLERFFKGDAGLFQKILAITSQAASVKANVGLALKAFVQMKEGKPFEGFLPAVIGNLNALVNETAIGGQKIGAYTAANEGNTEAVVVDRHIARMLFGVDTPSKAQFEKASKVLTKIAQEIGWTPRQVQAALWAASIVKSGKTPQSYGSYIQQLHAKGTLRERIGRVADSRSEVHGPDGPRNADSGGGETPSGLTPASLAENSVTPEQDAEYMAAVESGDVAKQQAMVDAAAKVAGYNKAGWHSVRSGESFAVFNTRAGERTDLDVSAALGTHFAIGGNAKDVANQYGGHPKRYFIRSDNPFEIGSSRIRELDTTAKAIAFRRLARREGHDSFIVQHEHSPDWHSGKELVALDPNQIKSADPITRDAEGNVIPLSQRFNPQSNSTLYSLPDEQGPPGVTDIGGEAEPADGKGTQLHQKKPTAIGSTYTTPADITLQEKRTQEETLGKARKIIGESVAADGSIKGRRAALDRFRLDTSIPPEVRAVGMGLIATQADHLANLEEGNQQLLLDEMTDEAAKLSGVIASDPDSFKNLKADANLNIDKVAEETARTLNIFSVFRRLTPEGFLRRMTRKYNDAVREKVEQNFDVPVEKVESEIALLRRLARESTTPERRKAILDAIKAYKQHSIDAKKLIEALFPQAGFRDRMNKGGELLVRDFFQMMAGPRDGKGPLAEFDETIQGALSSMLRKVMEAQGLVAKNASNQMTDIDKMVRAVSGDELRFDKIAAADEAMQKELAKIKDPERRATLQQAWEEATSKMFTNVASNASVRRAINAELKDSKVDWTKMFDTNQKPTATRAKVVDAVMGKIESLLTDPTDPTVQRNLGMLREEVGAAFDFIADNKRTAWLAQREAVEARRRVAEHRAAFMDALRNQGVAEQAINRISEKMAGPQRGKPDQNPVSALVGEHMKKEDPDFVDKMVALDVDRATAEQLDKAAAALRKEVAAAEKIKDAERAVKQLMKSLKPKPRAPREKIEKSLKALFTADTVGALDNQAFFDAFGEAFGLPPLSSEQQTKIKGLIREINSLPKGPARLDKQQDLDEELGLWKGIAARDVLLSAWYANILSGVSTQGMGMLGNLLNFVPRSLFNAISNPRSAGAYFQGAFGEGLRTGIEEAKAALKGRGLYKVSKYGDKNLVSALELLRKKGPSTLPEWVAYIASAGTRLRYVFRIMQAIDALAWNTAREGHAYLAAHRALLEQEKESGEKRSPEEFYKAFIDSLGGDTAQIEEDLRAARQTLIDAGQTPALLTVDRMAREARNARRAAGGVKAGNRFADRIVLQQEPEGSGKFISSLIDTFQKKGDILGIPFGQLLIPFNKIVSNLFEQSLDYTPVGALRAILGGHLSDVKPGSLWNGQVDFKEGTVQFDQMERRERAMAATAGMAAAAIIYALAHAHKDDPDEDVPFMVYGWGPESKTKRAQMPKGWVPYSVKIGDHYIKFSEMPFGMMFAAAGSAMDAMRYKNMDKKTSTQRLAYVLKTAAKGFMNQGVMSSLDTAMESMMFQASDKKFADIPVNAAKGLVPAQGLLRDINTIFDSNKVSNDSLTAALLRDIPFAKSWGTKPDLNVFGEPIKMDGYPIIRRITTHREPHAVADYLGRNDLHIPGMEQTIEIGKYLPKVVHDRIQHRAVELGAMENGLFTPEQNYKFKQRAGELTKAAVQGIMNEVPKVNNEVQRKHVQSVIDKKVELARRRAMLEAIPVK